MWYEGLKSWFTSICPVSIINAILSYIFCRAEHKILQLYKYWLLLYLPGFCSAAFIKVSVRNADCHVVKKVCYFKILIIYAISMECIHYCVAFLADKIPTWELINSALILHIFSQLHSCILTKLNTALPSPILNKPCRF